jgi:uncharacterized protein
VPQHASESKDQLHNKAHEIFKRADKQQQEGKLLSAFRLLLIAAKLGDEGAQLNLGYTYDVGLGVARNRSAALFWYRKAYRNGRRSGNATANIGTIYRDEQDDWKAIRWFQRAVDLGDIDANLDLAKIYLGSPKDRVKAIRCLKDLLAATPPLGVGEDTQREARVLMRKLRRQS